MSMLTMGWVAAMLGGCAGGDVDATSRRMIASSGDRSRPTARTVAGEAEGAAGIAGENPAAIVPIAPPPPPPASGTDPAADPNASACAAGQFCGPQGPDSEECGTLRLEQDVEIVRNPGNVLIVFDQSASMQEAWGADGGSKLQAAQAAVTTAVSSLQDLLTVGAIFFPTTACAGGGLPGGRGQGQLPGGQGQPQLPGGLGGLMGGSAVEPIEGPGQIPFQPAAQFLAAWNAHWSQLDAGLNVGTPMQEAFDRADSAIQSSTLPGQLIVLAFTDGQPNCFPAAGAMTATEPERAASWLAAKSVKTFVVGLPGAQGVEILNNVAVSGGTMQYILPDDPAALEGKLKELVSETIKMGFDSCSINLTPAADPVEKLQMVVEEKGVRQRVERMLSAMAGWSVSPDGAHVEITGRLCEDAKAGRFDSITFEYGCKELPPLPPPMGPI